MDKSIAYIDQITTKVNQLAAQRNKANEEKAELASEANKLQKKIDTLTVKVGELEERIDFLQHAKDLTGGGPQVEVSGDAHITRKKLNTYIREIDKCIALMSKEEPEDATHG